MRTRTLWLAGVVSILSIWSVSAQRGAPPPAPMPEILRTYRPVSADRLKNPADEDWLMIRRTYDGWGYSPLDRSRPPTWRGCSRPGSFPPARRAATKPRRS